MVIKAVPEVLVVAGSGGMNMDDISQFGDIFGSAFGGGGSGFGGGGGQRRTKESSHQGEIDSGQMELRKK
jgi:DnaJ-class molecular chaperone